MRIRSISTGVLLLASTTVLAQATTPGHTVKCWTENGRTVCGDALPASAAGSAQRVFNASGVVTQSIGRAPTAAEAAAQQAQTAAQAQAAAQAEAAAREKNALAESYDSEADLQRVYKQRMDAADSGIVSAKSSLATQRSALIKVLKDAADAELTGKPVGKPLVDAVARQRAAMLSTQASYEQQVADRARIDTELADALAKYRAAKGVPAPATP